MTQKMWVSELNSLWWASLGTLDLLHDCNILEDFELEFVFLIVILCLTNVFWCLRGCVCLPLRYCVFDQNIRGILDG